MMRPNDTVSYMKEHVSDLAYSGVQIEGIESTFAQTREILERGEALGVSAGDAGKIVCLKRGLQFLFENYEKDLSWQLYARYNEIVGATDVVKAGEMRDPGEVFVSGSGGDAYYPDDVSTERFEAIVDTAIATSFSEEEAACSMFLNLAKAQFFRDGNKRTGLMLTDDYLAHEDAGAVFLIHEDSRDEVLDLLYDYYKGQISLSNAEWDLEAMCIEEPFNAVNSAEPFDDAPLREVGHGETDIDR